MAGPWVERGAGRGQEERAGTRAACGRWQGRRLRKAAGGRLHRPWDGN